MTEMRRLHLHGLQPLQRNSQMSVTKPTRKKARKKKKTAWMRRPGVVSS
jgi:hypothetical protein